MQSGTCTQLNTLFDMNKLAVNAQRCAAATAKHTLTGVPVEMPHASGNSKTACNSTIRSCLHARLQHLIAYIASSIAGDDEGSCKN